jgi:hypothetical protein
MFTGRCKTTAKTIVNWPFERKLGAALNAVLFGAGLIFGF